MDWEVKQIWVPLTEANRIPWVKGKHQLERVDYNWEKVIMHASSFRHKKERASSSISCFVKLSICCPLIVALSTKNWSRNMPKRMSKRKQGSQSGGRGAKGTHAGTSNLVVLSEQGQGLSETPRLRGIPGLRGISRQMAQLLSHLPLTQPSQTAARRDRWRGVIFPPLCKRS